MTKPDPIETARKAAGQYLKDRGYTTEATMVTNGKGDDFPEVRIALAVVKIIDVPPPGPPTKRFGRRLVDEEC